MCAFVVFILAHVAMVAVTGFTRNMNHITLGTDDTSPAGLYLGLLGVGVVVALNVFANWAAWTYPRVIQHLAKAIVTPIMRFLLDHAAPLHPGLVGYCRMGRAAAGGTGQGRSAAARRAGSHLLFVW